MTYSIKHHANAAEIERDFGGYNSMPPNCKPISRKEFEDLLYGGAYMPETIDYRQVFPEVNGKKLFHAATKMHLYIWHDGTGVAVASEYLPSKKAPKKGYAGSYEWVHSYFKFAKCEHDMKGLSVEECRSAEPPIYHAGACYHVSRCTKCGYVNAVDSSD